MSGESAKRTEVICTKVTERIALDLLRAAAADDRSISEYVFLLIRRDLYGRTLATRGDDMQDTEVNKVNQ